MSHRGQDRAGQGARAADAGRGPPGPGRRGQLRRRPRPSGAVATTTGIAASGRETGCYLSVSTLADDGDETQTGFGFTVGRSPAELRPRPRRPARRPTGPPRLLGATKPPTGKVTVVLDPFVTAQFLGIIGSTLNGEAVLKGRSLFADRVGEDGGRADRHAGRRPHQPARLHRHARSTARASPPGATSLIDGGVLQQFVQSSYSGPPERHGARPATPPAAASRARPAAAAWRSRSRPGLGPRPSSSPTSTTACSSRWCRVCTRA